MNSNSLKTTTLGNRALLFAALLVVSQFAFANNQNQKKTPPSPPPAKTAPSKPTPAPAQPQAKPNPAAAQHPPTSLKGVHFGGSNKPDQGHRPTAGGSNKPDQGHRPTGGGSNKTDQGNRSTAGGSNKTDQGNRSTVGGSNNANPRIETGRFVPPSDAKAKPDVKGGTSYRTARGTEYHVGKTGNLTGVKTSGGNDAQFTSGGKLASIHTKDGITINRAGNGARSVESTRRDGTRVVSVGRGSGFTERTINNHGRIETVRTSVVSGRVSTYVYYRDSYRGAYFNTYVPVYFYAPGFYGWAYNPWASPVSWGWGWDAEPWYVSCGYYFAASPYYPGPAFWLTDYMLAQDLRAAHESAEQTPVESSTDDETSGAGSDVELNTVADDEPDAKLASGLVDTPVLVEGKQIFAPGFSATGSFAFDRDRIYMNAGGTARYSFVVSQGRRLTVAYNIPAGGYLNSVPAEISVNGVTIASIDKDPDYVWGAMTPKQRMLWHHSFPPGHYTLAIRSGGGYVSFYGLWIGSSSVGTPAQVSVAAPEQSSTTHSDENQDASALSPAVKKELADQVSEQINAEKAAAAGSTSVRDQVPAALDPNQRVFIVSKALAEQTTDGGGQCSLSPGDVLTRISSTPDADQNVTAMVTSSQRSDCTSGSNLAVSLQDLQDMHNDFVQKMGAGLQQLAANQGKKGMPRSPSAGGNANPAGQADADPTAVAAVQQQEQQADAAEQDVTNTTNSGQ